METLHIENILDKNVLPRENLLSVIIDKIFCIGSEVVIETSSYFSNWKTYKKIQIIITV